MNYNVIRHAAPYYSPNTGDVGKATPYVFDKIVKNNSSGHWQIGARFKGRDREWIEIFVPSDSDHSYDGFIRLFNQEKGDIVIKSGEMEKAARLLTNFYNSPSRPGNEKRTTQSGSQMNPKSVRHSAVDDDEVIDCTEDEHLEHAQHNYHQSVPHSDISTQTVYFWHASYSASTREGERKTGAFSATFYAYVGFIVDKTYLVSGTINRGQIKATVYADGKFLESSKIYDESLQGLRNAIDEALSIGVKNGKVASGQAAKAAVKIWDEKQRIESSQKANRPPKVISRIGNSKAINHSYTVVSSQDELYHHGILGMKWGVRRYQNEDGSLTDAGKKHYGLGDPKYQRKKGLAETETVMKRLNAVRNGKDVYIDKEKFRNSTGDEDEFKTGEAHAKATENYANYLSNSYRMFDSMIPKRMSGEAREEYIKYLLNQTVADLNANHLGTVEKGVKIVYQLDTSRGLDDIDFKLEFEYPDQRKIK